MNAETNHVIALDPVAGTPTALCWHPRESLLAVSLLGTKLMCICLCCFCCCIKLLAGNSVALLPADSFSGHREWSAPTPLVSLASSCAGLMFHPSRSDVLLLWGAEWIASYDPHALSETNHQLIKQKFRRRCSGTTTCGNVSVCSKYSPLVFVGTGLLLCNRVIYAAAFCIGVCLSFLAFHFFCWSSCAFRHFLTVAFRLRRRALHHRHRAAVGAGAVGHGTSCQRKHVQVVEAARGNIFSL